MKMADKWHEDGKKMIWRWWIWKYEDGGLLPKRYYNLHTTAVISYIKPTLWEQIHVKIQTIHRKGKQQYQTARKMIK